MRKIVLALVSCMALVAFTGLSASATAAVDPSCDGTPYDNTPLIHDFNIATPDSDQVGAVSGVEGSGLACGTDVSLFNTGTVYDHADVGTPPGVEINSTASMANGRFVGTSLINVASQFLGVVPDQPSVLTVEQINDADTDYANSCDDETTVGGPISGTIIACYRGTSALGFNHNWITVDSSDRKWLTIGPFHATGVAGLTHIKQFNLCGYVGAAGLVDPQYPDDCGTSSDPFLQKNGDATADAAGNGEYTVTATMRNGTTTPTASHTVQWQRPPRCKTVDIGGRHPISGLYKSFTAQLCRKIDIGIGK